MVKTKKTTFNTRAKGKGKAGTRRRRKTSNETAAGSNESRNFREEMISAFRMAGVCRIHGFLPTGFGKFTMLKNFWAAE